MTPTPDKPVTIERAESLVIKFNGMTFSGGLGSAWLKEKIEVEIQAAVDDGQKEVLEQNEVIVQVRLDAAYKRGAEEEREACAQIAENYVAPRGRVMNMEDNRLIAERIRARSSAKPGEEPK